MIGPDIIKSITIRGPLEKKDVAADCYVVVDCASQEASFLESLSLCSPSHIIPGLGHVSGFGQWDFKEA